jgi:hypothetical protein
MIQGENLIIKSLMKKKSVLPSIKTIMSMSLTLCQWKDSGLTNNKLKFIYVVQL